MRKLGFWKDSISFVMSTNRKYFFIVRNEIILSNNNSRATNPQGSPTCALALVEGVVSKKGSWIRFKTEKIG